MPQYDEHRDGCIVRALAPPQRPAAIQTPGRIVGEFVFALCSLATISVLGTQPFL